MEKAILDPFNYICSNPGKNVRAALIQAFQNWLQVPEEVFEVIVQVVDMLHNSSLMIDDIQDNSTLRRGQPAVHMLYGIPQTINCANMVYFLSLEKLRTLNHPATIEIFTDELLNLHRGQGLELLWRENIACPKESEYIQMVKFKTGGLMRLALKLMQVFSDKNIDYIHLVDLIGVHFQIRDDYINLVSAQFQSLKGFCEDLTEGKFSFPIIHHIHNVENTSQMHNILKQRTEDVELKKHAVRLLQSSNSFEYTKQYLLSLEDQIITEIERLGGNSKLNQLIEKLKVENVQIQQMD